MYNWIVGVIDMADSIQVTGQQAGLVLFGLMLAGGGGTYLGSSSQDQSVSREISDVRERTSVIEKTVDAEREKQGIFQKANDVQHQEIKIEIRELDHRVDENFKTTNEKLDSIITEIQQIRIEGR